MVVLTSGSPGVGCAPLALITAGLEGLAGQAGAWCCGFPGVAAQVG